MYKNPKKLLTIRKERTKIVDVESKQTDVYKQKGGIDMTLVEGLKELKAQGITRLVGMDGITDIDMYIKRATENHKSAAKYAAQGVRDWQHTLDHEDDNYMIETADGHHIIATHYGTFDTATYSDYGTAEEMDAAFNEWRIAQQAAEIADEKAEEDDSLPREAWVLVATMELRAAYKAAGEAFERKFGEKQSA